MLIIQAKPTFYKGTRFRSRLEVKWAVFFDVLKIKYEYEPEYDEVEFSHRTIFYKPDFYLEDLDLWIEIKPTKINELSQNEILKIVGWTKDRGNILVLCGEPSTPNERTLSHYYYSWNPKAKEVNGAVGSVWWCECPKCKKIDIRPYGGVPMSCDETCYGNPSFDLFGEEDQLPDGHKTKGLVNAYRVARNYMF